MNVYFDFDPSPFAQLLKQVEQSTVSGPIRDGMAQAGLVYLNFTRRLFLKNSRGGGDWPDLAVSTKVARLRKTKAGARKFAKAKESIPLGLNTHARTIGTMHLGGLHFDILRDTGLLFNSLSTGSPGHVSENLPDGIRVGTAIKYAGFHQNPTVPGRPPQRKIFVPPDEDTGRRITQLLTTAVVKALQQAGKIS